MPMIAAQELRPQSTTSGSTDVSSITLAELIARVEVAYVRMYEGDDWRELAAVSWELDRRVGELLDGILPALFAALESGSSRDVLRAALAFRRLPACARRYAFAVFCPELFHVDVEGGDDVTAAALTDPAIACRVRLGEGRGIE